jgi:hypothetical protein
MQNDMIQTLPFNKYAIVGAAALVVFAVAFTMFFSWSTVSAALTGGPDIIPAPKSVIDNAPGAENKAQQAFNEAQNVVLPAPVKCDNKVVLSKGARVNSHMIFLNTKGKTQVTDTQIWTFDGPIVCVMSDGPGSLEAASNVVLGAAGTTYPGGFTARGLEDNDAYSVSGNKIKVKMTVTEPGDWVRVVTEYVDTIPPKVACVETVNPSGKNVPKAGANPKSGQNPDGFYEILAKDDIDAGLKVAVVDKGADNILGTADDTAFSVSSGDKMKYTEANGATPSIKSGPGAIDWKIKGQGDAAVVAVDAAGNKAVVECLVPNPPK